MSEVPKPQSASPSPSPAPMHISSTSLRQFLDISPDALVIVNQVGTIVLVNGQSEAIFGYTRTELLGQPLELLLHERFHKAHITYRERYFASARTRPMGVGLHLVARRKDGTEFPVEISLSPLLLDGALHTIGAIRDMTAQRAAENERLQQLQHIRLQSELINLAHDAILVRDPVNRVISWNRGAEELYGWTAREARGRVTHTLLKTQIPTSRADIDARLEQEGQWEGELTHQRRDGSSVIVESRQLLLRDAEGQPAATIEINLDVTRRRHLEQTERAVQTQTAARLAFLQEVLDALPSGVYLVSGPDARLVLANRAASSVWGAEWRTDSPCWSFLLRTGSLFSMHRGFPSRLSATLRCALSGRGRRCCNSRR
jgi:PAS domain S-box-containing protein